MAFCSNCGKKLAPSAKFCSECGTPVEKADETARRTVYSGEIHKCPSCGEVLQSMTAICPTCGCELNSAKLAPALKEFIDEINECDKIIASTPKKELPKRGWKSWKTGTRVLWVILNVFTSCIPLVVYLSFPLLRPFLKKNATPELTSDEKHKVSLIENFAFPNDRESLLEALLFVKSKMAFLASEKADERNSYWMRLWNTKATQLHEKAKILLNNDTIAENAYTEIIFSRNTVDKKIRIRAGIGAAIIVAFCAFVVLNGSLLGGKGILDRIPSLSEGSPTIDENVNTDKSKGIYTYEIRNYIGKNAASIGEVSGSYLVDDYGSGELRVVFVTADGMIISPEDKEAKKNYTVVAQNIEAGANITVIHLRNSKGEPYSNLIDYQSYDEILLYVAQIGDNTYTPTYTAITPTLDRHLYHIRDYVGRNAASFGKSSNDKRIDEYGVGELRIVFTAEDGSYIDASDPNSLKGYIVVNQDIAVNTELKIEYETNSKGEEYDNLIRSQNYEEINLTVKRLDDSIISEMPGLTGATTSSNSSNHVELTVKYRVLSNGTAEITGFSGDGNHATIDSKIDGHKVVSIGDSAFKDCTTLESVLFWAEVETIGDYAFAGCTALKEISIPFETTTIGKYAFQGCTNLSSLVIWGDADIGDYAFAGCTTLPEVSIGYDTKSVGTHAFDGCTSLTTATIWNDDTIIGKDAFANCPNLEGKAIQE